MPSRISNVVDMITNVGLKCNDTSLLSGSSALNVMSKLRTMCLISCFWVFAIYSVIGASRVNGVMLFSFINFSLIIFNCAPSSNNTVSLILLCSALAIFSDVDGMNLDRLMELFSMFPLYAPKSMLCRWRLATSLSPSASKKAVNMLVAHLYRFLLKMC